MARRSDRRRARSSPNRSYRAVREVRQIDRIVPPLVVSSTNDGSCTSGSTSTALVTMLVLVLAPVLVLALVQVLVLAVGLGWH